MSVAVVCQNPAFPPRSLCPQLPASVLTASHRGVRGRLCPCTRLGAAGARRGSLKPAFHPHQCLCCPATGLGPPRWHGADSGRGGRLLPGAGGRRRELRQSPRPEPTGPGCRGPCAQGPAGLCPALPVSSVRWGAGPRPRALSNPLFRLQGAAGRRGRRRCPGPQAGAQHAQHRDEPARGGAVRARSRGVPGVLGAGSAGTVFSVPAPYGVRG